MSKRQSTRRDFLKGNAARDAMVDRLEDPASGPSNTDQATSQTQGCVLRVARPAMGGQFEMFFNVGQYEEATEVALEALDEVDRLEEQLSFYRATSEVSRINQLAADEPVVVEEDLFNLLQLAVVLNAETNGALDITAGPLSEVWGFSRREGKIPSQEELDEAMTRVGCDKLKLDAEKRTIHFLVPGMQINLGAIGKGYALDRCRDLLETRGIRDFMIHGGQSSIIACGSSFASRPADVEGEPAGWIVGLHDPTRHDHRLAEIRLVNRALATSGSEKQFFRHKGRRLSHVLDPRTGWPAEGLLSATVTASTAATADGLSTALFVMGAKPALAMCEARTNLAAALVKPKGNRVTMLTTGFKTTEFWDSK